MQIRRNMSVNVKECRPVVAFVSNIEWPILVYFTLCAISFIKICWTDLIKQKTKQKKTKQKRQNHYFWKKNIWMIQK